MAKTVQKKKTSNVKKQAEKKSQTLVIVESPSKANTIKKYLGKNFIVEASYGHLIDLPKSRLAVDVNHHFTPEYITIRGKAGIIKNLSTQGKKSKNILLATDPDREGEAIAWHLANVLKKVNGNIKRIMFNEITKDAVTESIQHPRDIDENLVHSQQARRILDRLVGYSISPLLWKRIKKGLSAGRVQSVVLKWICEREKDIESFISEEYWELDIEATNGKNRKFSMSLDRIDGEKFSIGNREEMEKILSDFHTTLDSVNEFPPESIQLKVSSVKKTKRNRKPPLPFTTSSLQQDAYSRLNFTTKKTMIVAQQLYEGVVIGKQGSTGLITYMRTDSIRINPNAALQAKEYVSNTLGKEYVGTELQVGKGKNVQDAHEAVRPTDIHLVPDEIEPYLSREQFKLYNLIWRRFLASQMSEEEGFQTAIIGEYGKYAFRAGGRTVTFPGFAAIYSFQKEGKKKETNLPDVEEGESIGLLQLTPMQKFTEPPPRYSESAIVSKLESTGIGRPSTFAPTIDTIQKRYYVTKLDRGLKPTELGKIVSEEMERYFYDLIDDSFTSELEKKLDQIQDGELVWSDVIESFYHDFHKTVENAAENLADRRDSLTEVTDMICEKCGKPMLKKIGRFGYFLACSGFPECRNAQSIPLGKCPKCGTGHIVMKKSKKRKGREFYSCDRYPDCDYITYEKPTEEGEKKS